MSIKITGFDFDKLEKDIKSKALHTQFDFECPHCHQTIKLSKLNTDPMFVPAVVRK